MTFTTGQFTEDYKMLDETLEELFQAATEFLDGELAQTQEYLDLLKERSDLEDALMRVYDSRFSRFLFNYSMCILMEEDIVARHYFEQGYLAAKNDT